jgi:enoyl-CoA hydratase
MSSSILHERLDGISVIRLNRQAKLNALSFELFEELSEEFKQLAADTKLRVVILTGTGRAFCSGTDISELAEADHAGGLRISERGQKLCDQIEAFPVPVIAAVNGIAAGGGCELALACHLRIASSEATFSLPETKLGLLPGYGGTQRIAREIGQARALEMRLTGKTIKAQGALDIGLVNRLATPSELLVEAKSLAAEIAQLAPLAIRTCLQAVTRGLEGTLEDGLSLERNLFASLFDTDDVREGTAAFLQKRAPTFTGK